MITFISSQNISISAAYVEEQSLPRISTKSAHFLKPLLHDAFDAHGAGNALKHDFGVVTGGAAKLDVANKQYAVAKRLLHVDVAHVGNADRIDLARNNPAVAFDIAVINREARGIVPVGHDQQKHAKGQRQQQKRWIENFRNRVLFYL